ncbi:MAG: Uma2 family endonuclease, partial [Gammaproteobacteria bacterium]|nr:Uma2 family endonuclease [Gammaproteobacteria bacterium]
TPSRAKKSLPGEAVKLAVEVADTTQRDDLGAKRRDYAKAGLPEYWVVDLKKRTLHRFSGPREGDYPPATLFREGEEVAAATLPGAVIRLAFPS